MVIPGLYDVPKVVAESGLTEDDVLNLGLRADGLVFMVVVPELGACRVPDEALSHFMAGADEYAAEGMPEHWSKQPSGPWTIKRDRLRVLADSWEKHSDLSHRLLDAFERQQAETEAEALRTPHSTREPGFYTLEEAARAIAAQESFNPIQEKKLCDDMLESDCDGTLTVRDGGGHARFAPIRPTIPRVYCELVTPADVNDWATRRGFLWRWLLETKTAPAESPATPEPVKELDYSLLATPAQLLDAFGKWGMDAAWFDDLNSRQWLLDARRKKGQGQRGHVLEPLFCPFAVMNGLIEKVRKAKRLQAATAWRTLEHKFPAVYATFESHDPRDRTGD